MVGFILLLHMQINIGDIVVIPAQNDHGVIQSIEKNYVWIWIYWNDGVARSICRKTLFELVMMKRWTYHAI
jgi:hypothetical protein